MKFLVLIAIFLLASFNGIGQEEYPFTIQVGQHQPLGNFNNSFDRSLSFGFFQNIRLSTENLILRGGGIVNFIAKSEPYNYHHRDSTFITTSSQSGQTIIGVWLIHEKPLKSKFQLNNTIGIGWNNIFTDTNKSNKKNQNYSVASINFNAGICLWYLTKKMGGFGVFIDYNITPFYIFNRVDKDFGTSSFRLGIQYHVVL